MKNIHLKIDDDLHLKVRHLQIEEELAGRKMTMMETFILLLEKGLTTIDTEKAAQK
ncbi:hypothetical protein [Jiulongibacter sediminis]|uniref:hypothetical protein n=1 Tax=Jiulongibacter sediminis TaxID=1605367 RepID=UPI0026F1A744|nr:hypothetical protein [Jiulongibacter sediminis]